jgi:isopentenyl-diphosphate delta-isomerase
MIQDGPATPGAQPTHATPRRKRDHIELALSDDSEFQAQDNGLDSLRLVHDALPELDFDRIELSTRFLDRTLRLPLIISSMTGGTPEAQRINRALARAAQSVGCAIAVGSQRAALEDAALAATYAVRDVAPDVLLLGNLGAVQLNYGYGAQECHRAVQMIGADGLLLHLNSLQEVLQPEGNRNFAGLLDKIEALCRELPFPVLLKTTGNGLAPRAAGKLPRLQRAGLAGLEVSGAGGTSWARIEALRGNDAAALAQFGDLGETTADSVRAARSALPDLPLIASGGIRHGVDVAKALALGADLVGLARPLLKAALQSADAVEAALRRTAWELQVACFYVGRPAAADLRVEDLAAVGNSPGAGA